MEVSVPVSVAQFQCMAKGGYSFAIVRGYHSYGAIDTNALPTLKNAATAGYLTMRTTSRVSVGSRPKTSRPGESDSELFGERDGDVLD